MSVIVCAYRLEAPLRKAPVLSINLCCQEFGEAVLRHHANNGYVL